MSRARLSPMLLLPAFAALCCAAPPAPPEPETPPACSPAARFDGSGFFRIADDCGRPVLVDPEGRRFFSYGVNGVRFDGDQSKKGTNPYRDAVTAKYGSRDAWSAAALERLPAFGFNTVGAWSDTDALRSLPYTPILSLAGADWLSGRTPDYFDPAWVESVQTRAAVAAARRDDANLVGWFLDNELHWGPDWRKSTELFDEYFALPEGAPGRGALLAFLSEQHGGDIARFNRAWRTEYASFEALAQAPSLPPADHASGARADRRAFLERLAERYFEVTTAAVRAADPNHLILGCRFVSPLTPEAVVRAAGKYVDVISVNVYEYALDPALVWPPAEFGFVALDGEPFLGRFAALGGRPLLVSEFGYRAADSGLPNSFPPTYPVLATQQERADRYEAYVTRARAQPALVGLHWFKYADQPAEGRFDGEDNNWGLVNLRDEPYAPFVARTAEVNRRP